LLHPANLRDRGDTGIQQLKNTTKLYCFSSKRGYFWYHLSSKKSLHMKIVYALLIFIASINIANAQRSKIVYLELGGNGIIYSLNYDTLFSNTNDDRAHSFKK
jgi:hypothetical protein